MTPSITSKLVGPVYSAAELATVSVQQVPRYVALATPAHECMSLHAYLRHAGVLQHQTQST